jgi:hypothetical protein
MIVAVSEGCAGHRSWTGALQHLVSELQRIHLLRTPVNSKWLCVLDTMSSSRQVEALHQYCYNCHTDDGSRPPLLSER